MKNSDFHYFFTYFLLQKHPQIAEKKGLEKRSENFSDLFEFFPTGADCGQFLRFFSKMDTPLLGLLPFRGLRPPNVQRLKRFP